MSLYIVFQLLSVATAFVFISAQPTCKNKVRCYCSSTKKKFTICTEQKTTLADPCTRWPGCKTCQGCLEDSPPFTATNPTLRSRRKRKCSSYGRWPWRSYLLNPVQSIPSKSEGNPVQRVRLVFCRDPGRMIHGNRVPIAATDYRGFSQGSSLEYSCNQGYTLQGERSISCLVSGRWSSTVPRCEELESGNCGRRSPAEEGVGYSLGTNGIISRAGEWPWVVSIKENNEPGIICGGALLNSRTVVTAAHCLTGSDSYTLYFGKIRRLDKEDDDKVVVRTSNRIIIHPYYSDTTFDSDIGLIQFSDPIRYTDRIQPICLPNTNTMNNNLKSGRMGSVAGFGETERALQPDNLMYFRLPVQDNKVCEQHYKEQGIQLIVSLNMFCAGYTDADQATCQGDSGSVLVFLDRVTEQYTLEGLVSFAANGQCGTVGKYIMFTKVFPYVPWLLENLA